MATRADRSARRGASDMHLATKLGLRLEAVGAAMVITAAIGLCYAG
ncbi:MULTISPECIES: hypothetical protein [unclassified Bradyrhizobium]|nr:MULTISPECIES: hypothetical protein [unclassified Bradyrhizobium]